MDAKERKYDFGRGIEKFRNELDSVWKDVDFSNDNEMSLAKDKQEAQKQANTTQLLSMEQFLPDSAPTSSYGCDSAEIQRPPHHEPDDTKDNLFSNSSTGMGIDNIEQMYHW